ncbi:uncharacterized protein N7511_000382 [Penicillium nucicola]|uniref:uncharacterized protein n=1 Tax=Penicillium nucicola TaxID=1850975 RepID=UPI002545B20F|nr:uncharacterized protein N7511_000382 [Penicillium nucicola]KAJ5775371.1 hypothetical protein N7511_000382 [Penicillium nucicola]
MGKISWAALHLASLSLGVNAYTSPCIYQSDKCGSTLATLYGYSVSELIAAVNQTSSIPQISLAQLFQVIYRCEDIYGGIVGNSLCIDGCIPANNPTRDDQCQLSEATTTVTVTTAAAVSCYKQCQTVCFGGSCSTCMNTMIHAPSMTPLLKF